MTLRALANEGSEAGAALAGPRHDSPLPGQLLGGKYRIEARVAEGGMGVVLRATHLELDCPVAIKLIRPEHTGNEEVIARLLAEARIAAGLRSKHVNHVLDVGRTAHGIPYLVLEFMEGSDLRACLQRRGSLPVSEAVDCVMQSCEALAEAHALGIVHRDLKPENLFLSEEADGGFVLKILDFGISKAPAARRGGRTLTNPFEVVGSPNYMAPEQIRGGQVDARSDIWALGALLYELCSGAVPFGAETTTETFSLILDARYELPAIEVGPDSEHLRLVIDRCLCKNPDDRYQSVVELADALSPLGSDMLQGRRVAKVAMATRARVAASAQPASPTLGTPLALSTNVQPELDVLEPTRPRRRFGLSWLFASAAALSLIGLGFSFAARGPSSSAAAAAPHVEPALRAPEPVRGEPAPGEALDARLAPPADATSIVTLPAALPASRPVPRKAAPSVRAARFVPPTSIKPAAPAATDLTSTPTPVGATPAPAAASANAWDPKTFGGRR